MDFVPNNGLEQYEISNFAKIGFEAKHNVAIGQMKNIWGWDLQHIPSMRKEESGIFLIIYVISTPLKTATKQRF